MVPYQIWSKQVSHDLKEDEGFREYSYPDPLSPLFKKYPRAGWGFKSALGILAKLGIPVDAAVKMGHPWTVGYGFTLRVTPSTKITREHADQLLNVLIISHLGVLDEVIPDWRQMPLFAISVVANMAFNMGNRLKNFKNSMNLIAREHYAQAGRNLRKSLWYKQTGRRAEKLIRRLENRAIAVDDLA